jgi:hypothetical protein
MGGLAAHQIKDIEELPHAISGEYIFSGEDLTDLGDNSDGFDQKPYSEGLGEKWLSDRRLFTPHWKL